MDGLAPKNVEAPKSRCYSILCDFDQEMRAIKPKEKRSSNCPITAIHCPTYQVLPQDVWSTTHDQLRFFLVNALAATKAAFECQGRLVMRSQLKGWCVLSNLLIVSIVASLNGSRTKPSMRTGPHGATRHGRSIVHVWRNHRQSSPLLVTEPIIKCGCLVQDQLSFKTMQTSGHYYLQGPGLACKVLFREVRRILSTIKNTYCKPTKEKQQRIKRKTGSKAR